MIVKNSKITDYFFIGILVGIFILGLFLRFGALVGTVVDTPVRADAKKYVTYAYNLSHHGVYSGQSVGSSDKKNPPPPDAVITPGYPIYLSWFFDKDTPIQWGEIKASLQVQTLLSALSVIMIFYVFKSSLGRVAGLTIAFLTAISPHLIVSNIYLLTESLFGFLLVFWLFVFNRVNKDSPLVLILFCGILLAATSLTRSWTQYFIFFLAPLLLWVLEKDRKRIVLTLLIGFFAFFAIWTIRNLVNVGESDNSLLLATLHHGMYPGMMYDLNPKSFGFPYRFDPESSYVSASLTHFFSTLWERFSNDPSLYLNWYLWGKTSMVMSWDIISGHGDVFVYPIIKTPYQEVGIFSWTHVFMHRLHMAITWLSILGALWAWAPQRLLNISDEKIGFIRVVSLLFLYFILIHMIAAPFPRYSIPIRPIMYGLAVFLLTEIWGLVRSCIKSRKSSGVETN